MLQFSSSLAKVTRTESEPPETQRHLLMSARRSCIDTAGRQHAHATAPRADAFQAVDLVCVLVRHKLPRLSFTTCFCRRQVLLTISPYEQLIINGQISSACLCLRWTARTDGALYATRSSLPSKFTIHSCAMKRSHFCRAASGTHDYSWHLCGSLRALHYYKR